MPLLEAFQFDVEVLDKDSLRRALGAGAIIGALDIFDPHTNIEQDEDWITPLVRIGGIEFPGRVCLSILGSGAKLAIVQTWDMPRPDIYRDIPGGADLPPTMSDSTTAVRAYSLVYANDCSTNNRVVAELWARQISSFEHDVTASLPLLLQPE